MSNYIIDDIEISSDSDEKSPDGENKEKYSYSKLDF